MNWEIFESLIQPCALISLLHVLKCDITIFDAFLGVLFIGPQSELGDT
jgi:hypothetical protein